MNQVLIKILKQKLEIEVQFFLLLRFSLIYFIKTYIKSESGLEKALLVNKQNLPLSQLLVRKRENPEEQKNPKGFGVRAGVN